MSEYKGEQYWKPRNYTAHRDIAGRPTTIQWVPGGHFQITIERLPGETHEAHIDAVQEALEETIAHITRLRFRRGI